jgi:pilus assembly protein Flp/PilA
MESGWPRVAPAAAAVVGNGDTTGFAALYCPSGAAGAPINPSNFIVSRAWSFLIAIHSTLGFVHQVPTGGTTRPSSGGTTRANATEAHLKRLLSKFWHDETGATAIEYGLIAAGIALAIIVIVNTLGTTLNTKFTSVNTAIN